MVADGEVVDGVGMIGVGAATGTAWDIVLSVDEVFAILEGPDPPLVEPPLPLPVPRPFLVPVPRPLPPAPFICALLTPPWCCCCC